ncbi:UDP-N-acetylmuramoyl-tripeptide--D-alanyl-D-alanine ligase [Myroides sp. LJL119]
MNITELYQCFLQCEGVSTDTRNITPNALFFALKGENFDGNQFAKQALEKGAKFVIMDNAKLVSDPSKMFVVPNALLALQQLARYHREELGLPIIALTGSNGKTTTKELITAILEKEYIVTATKGNLNNHIGVPLTLLSMTPKDDVAVIEMGANHKGEIAHLCEIINPDFGYITNFGKAHLEGFGSIEGVIKAKSELYDFLEDNKKKVFINLDDPIQDAKSITFSRYTFSNEQDADVRFDRYFSDPNAGVVFEQEVFTSNLTGLYNATNIAAAFCIASFFSIHPDVIQEAINEYIPKNNRSEWVKTKNSTILLDAYNANPSSMQLAIANFLELKTDQQKILILGDMFELGQHSDSEHLAIVQSLKNLKDTKVFFIGKHFYAQKSMGDVNHEFYADFKQFESDLESHTIDLDNKFILIKGSRAIALERTLDYI